MFYLIITVYDVSRRGGRVVILWFEESCFCLTATVRVMLGYCGTMAGLSGHSKLSQELLLFLSQLQLQPVICWTLIPNMNSLPLYLSSLLGYFFPPTSLSDNTLLIF